jgi:hypothetical protein
VFFVQPNVQSENVLDSSRIALFATRDIEKGEELGSVQHKSERASIGMARKRWKRALIWQHDRDCL